MFKFLAFELAIEATDLTIKMKIPSSNPDF